MLKKRGAKPKGKVKIEWSANFAYAMGLLATDGCVYSDRRHVNLTSKDREQILHFKAALHLNNRITKKARDKESDKKYYVIQFGDVVFVAFLDSIGIRPAKSKTLGKVIIPKEYFFDFLRGVFDGDGYVHSYFDSRWRSSFLWYLGFCSASPLFLDWIREELRIRLGVKGHITKNKSNSCLQLKYAKTEATKIVAKMYTGDPTCLSRKRLKIKRILAIVDELSKMDRVQSD